MQLRVALKSLLMLVIFGSSQSAYAESLGSPDARMKTLDKGIQLMSGEKYADAIQLFDRLLSANKNDDANYLALSNRGDAYTHLGKFDKAAQDLNKAIAERPRSENAYLHRATLDKAQHEEQKALDDLSKALEIMKIDKSKNSSRKFIAAVLKERAEIFAALGNKVSADKDKAEAAKMEKPLG